jgi:hypothetical protein
MFLKVKYHPDGTFDKLKARLVAGRDQHDKSLNNDLSTATVTINQRSFYFSSGGGARAEACSGRRHRLDVP